MNAKDPKPSSKELARRLSEVPPAAQAELIMELLDGGDLGKVLAEREWSASKDSSGHGSSWPTDMGDHRNESTQEGRTV